MQDHATAPGTRRSETKYTKLGCYILTKKLTTMGKDWTENTILV